MTELTSIKTRALVVKLGGEVVQGPYLQAIARDLAALQREGVPVVVVHGGGPQATELQKRLGQTPNVVAGRRITDEATLDVMKMTVAGKVNVDLCAALLAAGCSPVGLNGASACTVKAVKRPPRVVAGAGPDPIDFGHVGDVVGVNEKLLTLLVSGGFLPVIACLGASEDGQVFNINADIVGNQVAIALDAAGLFLITDVPAVLRDVSDPNSRIATLTIAEGKQAIADGVVTKGMIPKLEESFVALDQGVRAVHIVGKLGDGELLRAVREPGSVGTTLTK
jgi:acetylglutamate kinase